MKDLIERHYKATRKRGLITDVTKLSEFRNKIKEEFNEMDVEFVNGESEKMFYEAIDMCATVFNMFRHYGISFPIEFEKNVKYQESRVKNIDS